jgi:hypothetical protein
MVILAPALRTGWLFLDTEAGSRAVVGDQQRERGHGDVATLFEGVGGALASSQLKIKTPIQLKRRGEASGC